MLRGMRTRAFPDFWKREPLLVSSLSRFLEVGADAGELLGPVVVDTSPLNPSSTIPPAIGAANGLEFLGGDRILAPAEPVRRHGGDAALVDPGR
jgi:hypothetical protein